MKITTFLTGTVLLLTLNIPVFAQKYKIPADTVKLNAEVVKLNKEISDLSTELTNSQNNLSGYQSKAEKAGQDAHEAMRTSRSEASRATDGKISHAKSAKNEALKAYDKTKDAKKADNNLEKLNEKIKKYTKELENKQKRLKELDDMRTNIYSHLTVFQR